MILDLIALSVLAGMLIVEGLVHHERFAGGAWIPYARRFTGSAVLMVVGFQMVGSMERGVTQGWDFPLRLGYLGVMFLLPLYGMVIAVTTLFAFAGDKPAPGTLRGYVLSFTVLVLLMLGSAWLQERAGIPMDRSMAIILGSFALWIAIRPPTFVRDLGSYPGLIGLVGVLPVRILYAIIGLGLITAALTGATDGLFRP